MSFRERCPVHVDQLVGTGRGLLWVLNYPAWSAAVGVYPELTNDPAWRASEGAPHQE